LYTVIDTRQGRRAQLNELGAQGWRVVGVTTKKQLLIAPPQAIVLMPEVGLIAENQSTDSLVQLGRRTRIGRSGWTDVDGSAGILNPLSRT
jgi:hypothetical protein